jgi:prepilin-type N-terminal cleavage/methylation domain-containing protein
MGNLSWKQAFKRVKDTKRGFTLVELLIILTVMLVLSTIGMYSYKRVLAHARESVCETNLSALHEAITLFSTENDALPASLGHLKLEHLERAFAKTMDGREWLIKAYTFLIKLDTSDYAYAQFLTYDNLKKYGVSREILHCPDDHNGGASYAINSKLQGKTWAEVGRDVILVADCDNYTFSAIDQLAKRHSNKALGIKKSAVLVEVLEDQTVDVEAEEETEEADDDDVGVDDDNVDDDNVDDDDDDDDDDEEDDDEEDDEDD